jgi:hypothetical protein
MQNQPLIFGNIASALKHEQDGRNTFIQPTCDGNHRICLVTGVKCGFPVTAARILRGDPLEQKRGLA